MEVAKLLIEHGAPCGGTDRAGWSSFHYAANHRWATWQGPIDGQLAVLELLAAHGANINAGDGEGYTCVHSAAQSGKVEIVKLLRRLGARPDGTTVRGVLPIHVAAEGGRGEVVDELLRWCPEFLEAEDCRGHRPIHHAAYHGHADVVEVLLRHGASVCPGPLSTQTAAAAAVAGGGDGSLHHSQQSGQQSQGTTPLHLAVRSNKLAVVMVLLAGGANPLRLDSHGWTPRALASECAQRRIGAANQDAHGAIDRVLRQAEEGVPLIWCRAAHHKYPISFKHHARKLLCAMAGPMRRYDVHGGLVAEMIADEVIGNAAKETAWPEVTKEMWGSIVRTRSAVESRWRASGGGGGCGGGEIEGGSARAARLSETTQMELGWFGAAGYAAAHVSVAANAGGGGGGGNGNWAPGGLGAAAGGFGVGIGVSGGQGGQSSSSRRTAVRLTPGGEVGLAAEDKIEEEEDDDFEEVTSAPTQLHHHQPEQQQQQQQQQLQQQQQQQQQIAINVIMYHHQQQHQHHVHSAAAA